MHRPADRAAWRAGRRRGDPVPLALERIGRQRDAPSPVAALEAAPVDGDAARPERRQARRASSPSRRGRAAATAATRPLPGRQRPPCRAARRRADLEEDVCPPAASARTPSAKRTGSRACRRQYVAARELTVRAKSPVRFDTSRSAAVPTPPSRPAARTPPASGSSSGEWKACDTLSAWPRTPCAWSSASTAATAAARPETTVCSGPLTAAMTTLVPPAPQRRGHASSPAKMRRHRAPARQRLHQPAARGDEPSAVLQRAQPGDAGGDVLADAVAEHGGRLDAPRPPQLGQRVLEREQRGLRVGGLVERRGLARRGIEHVEQRPIETSAQQRVAALERRAEHRLGLVQLAPHAGVLRALPGEQEDELGDGGADVAAIASAGALRRPPRRPGAARAASRSATGDRQPVRELRPAGVGA